MARFVFVSRRSSRAFTYAGGACIALQACGEPARDPDVDSMTTSSLSTTSTTPPADTSTATPPGTIAPTSTTPGETPPGTSTPAPTTPAPSSPGSISVPPPVTTPPTSSNDPTSTGDDSSGGSGVATLDEIRDILLFRCGNLICHMPPPYTPPNFGLAGDDLFTLLTTFTVEKCAGSPLIVPSDTANSAILKVVSGGCGDFYMPPDTYDPFTDEELATLTAWVEAGAPK